MAKGKEETNGVSWKNRIVSSGVKKASAFVANPLNFRKHPENQRSAIVGSLNQLGWIQEVIVNRQTGNLIDGHARVEEAYRNGDTEVPYKEVDLSPEEEKLALAVLDPISAMAETDSKILDHLLKEVQTGDAALQQLVAKMAEDAGLYKVDGDEAPVLPSGNKEPFQQMTFTLHDTQAEIVKQAINAAKGAGDFAGSPNENSNGNALARIAEAYCGGR